MFYIASASARAYPRSVLLEVAHRSALQQLAVSPAGCVATASAQGTVLRVCTEAPRNPVLLDATVSGRNSVYSVVHSFGVKIRVSDADCRKTVLVW